MNREIEPTSTEISLEKHENCKEKQGRRRFDTQKQIEKRMMWMKCWGEDGEKIDQKRRHREDKAGGILEERRKEKGKCSGLMNQVSCTRMESVGVPCVCVWVGACLCVSYVCIISFIQVGASI
jgi:hypothetical protein